MLVVQVPYRLEPKCSLPAHRKSVTLRQAIDEEIRSHFPDAVLALSKNQMQAPNVRDGEWSKTTHITWERNHVGNTRDVHFRAIFDDKGRIMVMICHNTDNGDGWEREGEYEYYFHEFSEKKAYPLGINIVFYAMTH